MIRMRWNGGWGVLMAMSIYDTARSAKGTAGESATVGFFATCAWPGQAASRKLSAERREKKFLRWPGIRRESRSRPFEKDDSGREVRARRNLDCLHPAAPCESGEDSG